MAGGTLASAGELSKTPAACCLPPRDSQRAVQTEPTAPVFTAPRSKPHGEWRDQVYNSGILTPDSVLFPLFLPLKRNFKLQRKRIPVPIQNCVPASLPSAPKQNAEIVVCISRGEIPAMKYPCLFQPAFSFSTWNDSSPRCLEPMRSFFHTLLT